MILNTFFIHLINEIKSMSNYLISNSKLLKKTITILNKNGYHTKAYNKASISIIFVIRFLINELIIKKILKINNDNVDKIKTIIKNIIMVLHL